MPEVVGVRFKECGKVYSFKVNGVYARPGMRVIVESEMGLSLGIVVKATHTSERPEQQTKKILRIATVQDIEADRNNRSLENEAMAYCVESAQRHNLFMKVVKTEVTLDRKRFIFYFTAEGRIDFRELVRDLASKFKTRIEMRQIGVRDEVKCIGGIGCCGREVCCKVFLTSFEPISIRMAKKQELSLNPGKLSGICGRLMCCLGYEVEQHGKVFIRDKIVSSELTDKAVTVYELNDTELSNPEPDLPQHEDLSSPEASDAVKELPAQLQPSSEETQPAKEQAINPIPQKTDRGKPFNRRKKFWRKRKPK